MDELLEALAAHAHESWAGWVRWMLNRINNPEWIACWKRQMDTPYHMLSEEEKESYREKARKILHVIGSPPFSTTVLRNVAATKCDNCGEVAVEWNTYNKVRQCFACGEW